MGRDAHTEGEHVPTTIAFTLGVSEPLHVVRIVELPIAVERDVATEQCAQAVEAGPFRAHRVNAPVDVQQRAIFSDPSQDAAIDDGDEM